MRKLARFSYLISMAMLCILATALFCWLTGFPKQ